MPFTVAMSFDQFRANKVDLDPDETDRAKRSRDYLEGQISQLPAKDNAFPPLYGGFEHFGSFARKTKVRPLDDIDFMVLLNGKNTVSEYYSGYTYKIRVTDSNSVLWTYSDSGYLNSTRVLNKFKSGLQNVANYQKADIKRTGEAVTLKLTSYPWVFDIVPAFPVSNGSGSIDYYLMPDGNGQWKRTDPRRDQKSISDTNKRHNSNFIPLVRLIKYWNVANRSAPRIGSYHLETMLISAFGYQAAITSIRGSIPSAFQELSSRILYSCPDPKGLGPALDESISQDTRTKVSEAASKMAQYSGWALEHEAKGDHKQAIMWWGYVFPEFPAYGS